MKRKILLPLLLVAPTLLIVRAVVRYYEEQQAMERVFGTEEQQKAATARIIAGQQTAQKTGASTGAHETEQGCLVEGFKREKSGPREYSRLMHFLEGCLRTAKPTPGFCDQVPPYRATMSPEQEERSRTYQQTLCRKEGLDDLDCRASVRMVQLHCHPLK